MSTCLNLTRGGIAKKTYKPNIPTRNHLNSHPSLSEAEPSTYKDEPSTSSLNDDLPKDQKPVINHVKSRKSNNLIQLDSGIFMGDSGLIHSNRSKIGTYRSSLDNKPDVKALQEAGFDSGPDDDSSFIVDKYSRRKLGRHPIGFEQLYDPRLVKVKHDLDPKDPKDVPASSIFQKYRSRHAEGQVVLFNVPSELLSSNVDGAKIKIYRSGRVEIQTEEDQLFLIQRTDTTDVISVNRNENRLQEAVSIEYELSCQDMDEASTSDPSPEPRVDGGSATCVGTINPSENLVVIPVLELGDSD